MIKEALEYLATKLAAGNLFELTDGPVFDKAVHRPPLPTAPPLAKALSLSTLRSLADYVRHSPNGVDREDHLLHVLAPDRVELVSSLEDFHRRREVEAVAGYESPADDYLDAWTDLEDLVIALMTVFESNADRDALLAMLKSIASEDAEVREDDGLAQKVTTMQGVRLKGTTSTTNPVALAPFRYFPGEVGQVSSPFIVRLRKGGCGVQVLLRPADGGAWKVEAARAVAAVLEGYLADVPTAPAILY